MYKKSWTAVSEIGYFSMHSKCKAIAEGISAAEGIGKETSGGSSPGNWSGERNDCVMSECCLRVAEIHLCKRYTVLVRYSQ